MNDKQYAEIMAEGARAAAPNALVYVESAQEALDVYEWYGSSATVRFRRQGRWYMVIVRCINRRNNSYFTMVYVSQAHPNQTWGHHATVTEV